MQMWPLLSPLHYKSWHKGVENIYHLQGMILKLAKLTTWKTWPPRQCKLNKFVV